MDKIIINDQEINLISATPLENGLEIKTAELTLTEAENLFPFTSAVNFEISNSTEVYGKYANLKAYSIEKKAIELDEGAIQEAIEIKLGVLNNTTKRLNQVEEAVDTLVMMNLGM